MHRMITKADVLTTNFLDRRLRRYKLSTKQLRKLIQGLYALSAVTDARAEVERRAFDITAWWARSGMMEFVEIRARPLWHRRGMGDHSTATAFFGAIADRAISKGKDGKDPLCQPH